MPLENTAENDAATPDGDAAAAPANLESLNDLLVEEFKTLESDDVNGAAVGNDKEKAKPEMFNDLAEAHGIKLDDLYKLKVTTADGETVTIEELKSLQTKQDDIVLRDLEFEETRAGKEGQLRQAQNEISEIVAALPAGTIKPAMLDKLRAKNVARVELEQSRTLTAIPTWSDEPTRTSDMKGMTTHLERFGFPSDYLGSVVDHRMFVFIRESHLREQRIKNALERVRAGKPNPTTPTKIVGKSPGKTVDKPKNANARNGLEQFFSDV
jgi:hypothetical protein